jgi:hypothetical protein
MAPAGKNSHRKGCASSQTIRRFLGALYDDAVATAIVAFSSRDIISVTIRRLLTV